jgi:NADPH:quinone reductase-like Zn-dependent oxidoreductase
MYSICYLTAASAIHHGLNISIPFIPGTKFPGSKPKSILILGGSSGVGAAAIQILRLALPSSIIFTTSSLKHEAHLFSLGATKVFDRSSVTLIADIKTATEGGKGVEVIVDAVGCGATQKDIFKTLDVDGPRGYAQVFTGAQITLPPYVKKSVAFGRMIFDMPGGKNAMSVLSELVSQGIYKFPIQVENVVSGLEAIVPGLGRLSRGVSGTKLVVTV